MDKNSNFDGFTQKHFTKLLDIFSKYDNKCRFVVQLIGVYHILGEIKKDISLVWRKNEHILKNIYLYPAHTVNLHKFLCKILLRNLLIFF